MPWFRGDGFRTAVKIIGLGEWGGVGGWGLWTKVPWMGCWRGVGGWTDLEVL